ncbi:PKD domain-containing protein [Streptomyces sp. NPDC085524]|uniref:PKD domain-containing protein n=1 Tax=unclassified Streptomyces TaxID=2593676 RepID=UPI0035D743C6
MISAAAVAAAVGFAPAVAHAAAPAADRTPATGAGSTQGPAAQNRAAEDAAAKLEAATAAAAKDAATFNSPAGRSVVKVLPGTGGPSAAAPHAAGAQAEPDFKVGLGTYGTGARTMRLATLVTTDRAGMIRIDVDWGDGRTETEFVSSEDFGHFKHTYAEVGAHKITVTATDPARNVSATNSVDVVVAGSEFTPHAPARLLDTRDGTGAASAHPVGPYATTRVKIGGNGGIPAGVTSVALNITATNATNDGHIAAYASGKEKPATSNVNFAAGQSVPNLAIVPVGEDGYVELANGSAGSVDLIADVAGYFTRSVASGYTALDPVRLVDTRYGQGTAKGQVAGQGTFGIQVAGQGGLPANGVKAVALNVTVTDPKQSGHLTVFPSGQQAPLASNLNFTAGQTVANSVIVPVGQDGRISIRNGSWNPADVIVDVTGYYGADGKGAYLPVAPERLHDSRLYNWPLDGQDFRTQWLYQNDSKLVAAALNTTVTNTRGSGHLTVAPDPNTRDQYLAGKDVRPTRPNSSNLNWTKDTTVSNLVQANAGKDAVVDFWNGGWEPADLVIDLFGVYATD